VDSTAIFALLRQTRSQAFKLVGFCKGWVGTSPRRAVRQVEITHESDVRMNREKAAS